MNIIDAAKAMRDEKHVRRKGWKHTSFFRGLADDYEVIE